MSIEITGRHIDVPSQEKQRVEERLNRLERHTGRIDEARLVVTGERHRVLAEAIISSGRESWKAHQESADLSTALVAVLDKIEAQAQKDRARRKDHKGKLSASAATSEWEVEVIEGDAFKSQPQERRIVKTTRIPIKPMSAEEAALELGHSLHEFIVFQDASTERVSVLYKRRDGNFGLIAPEW